MQTRICVYTCIMGGYETLNELTIPTEVANYEKFCFTDDPDLKSDTWTIKYIEPAFPMDSVRSQRRVKILAHEYLPDFDISLYVDNSVKLLESPIRILNTFLDDETEIALPLHSYRERVGDEFLIVANDGLDEPSRIFEQLTHYQIASPEVLKQQPFWTGLLLRRHLQPSVRRAMDDWYNQVMRYSRRDQLSINEALTRNSLSVKSIDVDNFISSFHQWPTASNRKMAKRYKDFAMAGETAAAQSSALQLALDAAAKEIRQLKTADADISKRLQHVSTRCHELELHCHEVEAHRDETLIDLHARLYQAELLREQAQVQLEQTKTELKSLLEKHKDLLEKHKNLLAEHKDLLEKQRIAEATIGWRALSKWRRFVEKHPRTGLIVQRIGSLLIR